jgi:hypothetical protein
MKPMNNRSHQNFGLTRWIVAWRKIEKMVSYREVADIGSALRQLVMLLSEL